MDQVLGSKKCSIRDTLKQIIHDEQDPFELKENGVKALEKKSLITKLNDSISEDEDMKRSIINRTVARLLNEEEKGSLSSKEETHYLNTSRKESIHRITASAEELRPKTIRKPWEMATPEITPEVKRDLQILSMRGFWDSHSFFKGDKKKKRALPKEFEIGTVIEGNFDNKKQRLTRKEKKDSLASELMSDKEFIERANKTRKENSSQIERKKKKNKRK